MWTAEEWCALSKRSRPICAYHSGLAMTKCTARHISSLTQSLSFVRWTVACRCTPTFTSFSQRRFSAYSRLRALCLHGTWRHKAQMAATIMFIHLFDRDVWLTNICDIIMLYYGGLTYSSTLKFLRLLVQLCLCMCWMCTVASPGAPRVTSSRDWQPNESLNIVADEFTRTLDNRSPGKAERVRVVTVVCMTMTKKSHHVWGKNEWQHQ